MTLIKKSLGFLGQVIQLSCIVHCTFQYIGDLVLCAGPSMEPTIYSNDILLTEHISAKFNKIHKGDIVIAKSPSNPKYNICKRVIGVSGDRVKVAFGFYETVPRGHVWLEGDNYINSADSREFGPVPLGLIRSRALCRVWPIQDMKILSS